MGCKVSKINRLIFGQLNKGNKGLFINYVVSGGGGGGVQKFPILLSKKMTNMGGGGQKFPILRRHSLWMAPHSIL